MGACASKRTKAQRLEEVEQKCDVLTSLFATRAEDLANIVSEFEASKKAEAIAYEEVMELRELWEESEAKLAISKEDHCREIAEWKTMVECRDNEILACQRVVEMRTKERYEARNMVVKLEKDLREAKEHSHLKHEECELLRKEMEMAAGPNNCRWPDGDHTIDT